MSIALAVGQSNKSKLYVATTARVLGLQNMAVKNTIDTQDQIGVGSLGAHLGGSHFGIDAIFLDRHNRMTVSINLILGPLNNIRLSSSSINSH